MERADIQSPDPDRRIRAIRAAADANDKQTIPLLVDRLEDEDSGVRFFAIVALERMTGERFGYDYGQPAWERAKSVEQWRAYVRRNVASSESSLASDVDAHPAAASEAAK